MNKHESGMMAMDRRDRVVVWIFVVLTIVAMVSWRLTFGSINHDVVMVVSAVMAFAVIYAIVAGRIYRKRVLRARRAAQRQPVRLIYVGDGELTHQGQRYDLFDYVGDIGMADTAPPVSPL
ncbi:MAG TPA: hypothetical protein PLU21_00430 [Candidatus Saccharibacteria bacterium]|nr:hypothetical protein [Candidatus Saccharibacteria bacterium]